jgi:peptidoglycan hydrolase-like amidase
MFLSGASASELTQVLAYQKAATDQDKVIITNIAITVQGLEDKKKILEDEQTRLTAIKVTLDDQSAKLDKIVTGAKAYQANISGQIAELSATQQQLLSQKLGSLGITLNSYSMLGGCKSDILPGAPDPGFSPKLGFFTYGVPNRVGLNQFGALGRAKAGQDYTTILQAYYNFDSISDVSQSTQIHVSGNGIDWTGSLEDYMKRIYEVPDSWTDNDLAALKAQAVAARSYVLAYTNNGQGSICPTDQCQVFQTNPKGGNWEQAVNATAGKAMVQGGQPIKAWFSSTHGGYVFTSADIGWSSTSFTKRGQDASGPINSFSDLQNNSYDKASPWFYCDWGSRGGTAWLKQDEVADIVNVTLLVQADSGTKEHLYQQDKSNPAGTDTWSSDRVKQELKNRNITPFNSVSGVSVDADFGVGKVTTVHINGDAGSTSFSGDFFKTYFNIRAPGNINIVGPLYNIEQR